jgi:predicted GNAT family N-acyltransferase
MHRRFMRIDPRQRDFREDYDIDVHGIIVPADIRQTDVVSVRIRASRSAEFTELRAWNLSPLGVEVVDDGTVQGSNGSSVEVEVDIGKFSARFDGFLVRGSKIQTSGGPRLIGIRFTVRNSELIQGSDRRSSSRWICNAKYDPVCIAANPARFNDFVYFRVRDISRSGLRLVTSLRNKFLLPGMHLDLQVSLPLTAQIAVRVTISRVRLTTEDGKDLLELGVTLGKLTRAQRESIGQYLVQFSNAGSLETIKSDGFIARSLSRGIEYEFIKSEQDYRSVLALRLLANRIAEKIPSSYALEDMADIYDIRSRIIAGKYRGQIVGTIRVTFFDTNDQLEHSRFMELPPDFPKSHEILECSRAATHPDFRGSDLWLTLLQHIAILALLAKREWVLISTTAELVDMYSKMGFKDTGLRYEHDLYPGVIQHTLLINVPRTVMGEGVGPIYWNVIWRDVSAYLADSGMLLPSTKSRIYSLLSPLSMLARYLSRRPRKT